MTNQFRFNGPIDHATGGGANFQITFANGLTVSVADTSMSSDFQRIEVAVLEGDNFLTDSMVKTQGIKNKVRRGKSPRLALH